MDEFKITISTTNSKLGSFIPSFNFPPIVTCRKDAPCKKMCYACKGNFLFKNVKLSSLNNYQAFLKDSKRVEKEIINFVDNKLTTFKYFRWFSSGDIASKDVLQMMVNIAKKVKKTKFLCFTKQFEIVNDYLKNNTLPKNLIIVYSHWDKSFKVDNPYNMPTSHIAFRDATLNEEISKNTFECKNDCSKCLKCWRLKQNESIYFHQH